MNGEPLPKRPDIMNETMLAYTYAGVVPEKGVA
jgi:hypothetical protein